MNMRRAQREPITAIRQMEIVNGHDVAAIRELAAMPVIQVMAQIAILNGSDLRAKIILASNPEIGTTARGIIIKSGQPEVRDAYYSQNSTAGDIVETVTIESRVNRVDGLYLALLLRYDIVEGAAAALAKGSGLIAGSNEEPTYESIVAHLKRLKDGGKDLEARDEEGVSFMQHVAYQMNQNPALITANGGKEFDVADLRAALGY
jgi:hypothetical protein